MLGFASAQLAGGWTQITYAGLSASEQAQYKKALNEAVNGLYAKKVIPVTSVTVEKAFTQVVSGTNWEFDLQVNKICTKPTINTVVYENLQSQYSLTSWAWQTC